MILGIVVFLGLCVGLYVGDEFIKAIKNISKGEKLTEEQIQCSLITLSLVGVIIYNLI